MQQAIGPGQPVVEPLAEVVSRQGWRRQNGKAVCPISPHLHAHAIVCACVGVFVQCACTSRKVGQRCRESYCVDLRFMQVTFFSFPEMLSSQHGKGPPQHSAYDRLLHTDMPLLAPYPLQSHSQLWSYVSTPPLPAGGLPHPFTSCCSQPSTPWCSSHYYYFLLIESIFRTVFDFQKN